MAGDHVAAPAVGPASLTVGIIGLGAIGGAVADAIAGGRAGQATLAAILLRDTAKAGNRAGPERLVTSDAAAFLSAPTDLIVEAAGHEALRAYGEAVLGAGKDLMLVSVGALADDALWERLLAAARERRRRIHIVSGAIGGLDAIGAAAIGGLDEVEHTIRKPPHSVLPAAEADAVQRAGTPRELFAGSAREAAPRYPENVNVALALSLAGIGMDRTRVRLVADPAVTRNTHDIVACGHFGELRVTVQNIPTENPKTGRLTALSVIKAIRDLTAAVTVGS